MVMNSTVSPTRILDLNTTADVFKMDTIPTVSAPGTLNLNTSTSVFEMDTTSTVSAPDIFNLNTSTAVFEMDTTSTVSAPGIFNRNTSTTVFEMDATTNASYTTLAINLSSATGVSDFNWTFDDLMRLNNAKAEALLPAMFVIGLYMVVGVIGNSLVCYIMGFKLKMNTQNMLIIYLAVFDLLNCLICMPADIHDMKHYYYFPTEIGCKIVRMIMNFTSEASILTLLVIAVDRYRKICKPMKSQMNLRHTKRFLALVLSGGVLLSTPALVIFGFRTIDTGIPGISGHDCSISDSLKGTLYPMIYSSTLFLLFIVLCVCLIALYSCVLSAARRHRNYMSRNSRPNHFTCLSIRGVKYAKNSQSTSVTMTTEDTSGLRHSNESLHTKTIHNVNTNSENNPSQLTQSEVHPKPQSKELNEEVNSNVSKICRDAETLEEINGNKKFTQSKNTTVHYNSDNREAIENSKGMDRGNEPSFNLHCLRDSLNQRLEMENSTNQIGDHSRPNTTSNTEYSGDNQLPCKADDGSHDFNKQKHRPSGAARYLERLKSFGHKTQDSVYNSASDSETIDGEPRKKKKKQKSSLKMSKMDHKTTIIAFMVTIVFILSYMPYLSLQISKQIWEGLDYDLQGASLVFYNISLRSYYINSISNPIIYGLLNNRFRQQLLIVILKPFRIFRKG